MIAILAFAFGFLFFVVIMISSRRIANRVLEIKAQRIMRVMGKTIDTIECSYEGLIYMVSLPVYDVTLQDLSPASIHVELDRFLWLFPTTHSMRIVYHDEDGGYRLLAYLALEALFVPLLDEQCERGVIDKKQFTLMRRYLFEHKKKHHLIIQEVLDKIQSHPVLV